MSCVVCDEVPRRIVIAQHLTRNARTCAQGRAGDHPLETIAVEWAGSGEVVAYGARNPHVAHLRMNQPVKRFAGHDRPAADTRTTGEVEARFHTLPTPPAHLADCRRADVRIEDNRYAKCATDVSPEVGVLPARLGRRRDVPPGWGVGSKIHGP